MAVYEFDLRLEARVFAERRPYLLRRSLAFECRLLETLEEGLGSLELLASGLGTWRTEVVFHCRRLLQTRAHDQPDRLSLLHRCASPKLIRPVESTAYLFGDPFARREDGSPGRGGRISETASTSREPAPTGLAALRHLWTAGGVSQGRQPTAEIRARPAPAAQARSSSAPPADHPKPIGCFFDGSGSLRSASTCLKRSSICRSCLTTRRARSSLLARISRRRTKVRTIAMLTCTARLLRSTEDNMATPCSVNARGGFRRPPQLEIAICDFKFANSSALSRNTKSSGKRSRFLVTAWLRAFEDSAYRRL